MYAIKFDSLKCGSFYATNKTGKFNQEKLDRQKILVLTVAVLANQK